MKEANAKVMLAIVLEFTFVSLESRLLTGEWKSKWLSPSPARLIRELLRLSGHKNTQLIQTRTDDCFNSSQISQEQFVLSK